MLTWPFGPHIKPIETTTLEDLESCKDFTWEQANENHNQDYARQMLRITSEYSDTELSPKGHVLAPV